MLVGCVDKTNGYTDENGYGCDFYERLQGGCGLHDTNQFTAKTMCCACKYTKGNSRNDKIPYHT